MGGPGLRVSPELLRVVAELRRDREAGLCGDDAGERPAADEAAGPSFVVAGELAAAAEGEFVEKIDDADVADVECGEAFVGGEVEGIRNEAGRVVGGGLVEGVAVVESFGEGVGAAEGEAVAETAAKVDLECVVGADAFGEPRPGVGDGGVGFFCAGGNVEGAGRNWGSGERRADRGSRGWDHWWRWSGSAGFQVGKTAGHGEAGQITEGDSLASTPTSS